MKLSDKKYTWSPEEEVPWSRIEAAVPGPANALQVVLDRCGLTVDQFCRWRDGTFELDDESNVRNRDEWLELAWDHLAWCFEQETGLKLCTFCRHHGQSGNLATGFEVVGAWQRSPAGKRFFGIKTQGKCHKR